MEDLLTQAEAAIDDPSDTELMEVMADTREVLEWSKQRHWTFAWWIIICVAIMGCYYFYQAGSEQDYVAKRQALTDEQVQTELSEAITRQQSYIDTYSQKLAVDTISEETRSLYEKYMENATEEIKELKEYIEDVFTDQNDINEDTRIQLELINQTLAELQTKDRGFKERKRIGYKLPGCEEEEKK